jgi:hypothetical protein
MPLTTTPQGLYKVEATARTCALVCRPWRDAVFREARTCRIIYADDSGCGVDDEDSNTDTDEDEDANDDKRNAADSSDAPLSRRFFDRHEGLRTVLVKVEATKGEEDLDDALDPEYLADPRTRWRQIQSVCVKQAPRRAVRMLRLLSACPSFAAAAPSSSSSSSSSPFASLASLALGGRLCARNTRELGKLLTHDRFPALRDLDVSLAADAQLDWPYDHEYSDVDEEEGCDEDASLPPRDPPPRPAQLVRLHAKHPLKVLQEPTRKERRRLGSDARTSVSPRLLEAFSPTLRDLGLALTPPSCTEDEGDPRYGPNLSRESLVPLEALGVLFDGLPGLRIERLTLRGYVDWERPPRRAEPPARREPYDPLLPPADPPREFDAVVQALAPNLRELVLCEPGLDGAPGTICVYPRPELARETWLPECMSAFTRLEKLKMSVDVLPTPYIGGDTTPASVPPRLRELALDGGRDTLAQIEHDAFEALGASLELLDLAAGGMNARQLPRALLDSRRMPRLKRLTLMDFTAEQNAALLSTLSSRGRVEVSVRSSFSPSGKCCSFDDWYSGWRPEGEGTGAGDGDHWAADYAADGG